MGIFTIRPASVVTNGGGMNPSSAATVLSRLSDNSDATFVDRNTLGAVTWSFGMSVAAMPADEYCWRSNPQIRHSAGSVNDVIGVQTRRAVDPVPPPSVFPGQSAVITQSGGGEQLVAWTAAELSTLVMDFYSQEFTGAYMRFYELLDQIATAKQATAVPAATTMSASAVPLVPVTVTSTLTADENTWSGLRKARLEVRIESGGTTVGTGTLIDELSFDYDLSVGAALAEVKNAAFVDSLPNGTYRVYARVTRFRTDYPTVRADQVGPWSTAAILTMSVPLPNAPTLALTQNDTAATVTATVTGTSSAGYSSPLVTLQRNDGFGWVDVRGATRVPASFGVGLVLVDREARRGFLSQYRARISATYTGGAVNDSAWSATGNVTLALPATWNLRSPEEPSLDILNLNVVGGVDSTLGEELGVFRPIDRRYPVVVAGELTGWDGSLTVDLLGSLQWQELEAVMECQRVLLLQTPYGKQQYIRLLPSGKVTLRGTPTAPRRRVSLSYVETEAP